MNTRVNPFVWWVVAFAWWLVVAAALLVVPLLLRDRLPDPMATHWGAAGGAPDGSKSFTGYVVTTEMVWAGLWLVCVSLSIWLKGGRAQRMARWGALFGLGAIPLGTSLSTLAVNLDVPGWRAAVLPGWHIPLVLGVMVALAVLAGYVGRGDPDQPSADSGTPPRLRLRPGQRVVWVGRVANPRLTAFVALSLVLTVVVTVRSLAGAVSGSSLAVVLPVLAIVLLAGLATMAVSVRVGGDAVRIGFGPLGWPVRRIRLSAIESATAEERSPRSVGGWGWRGLPGDSTIMLRGGECLVLRYRSGGRLAISIDDAERGASLINALIAERVHP